MTIQATSSTFTSLALGSLLLTSSALSLAGTEWALFERRCSQGTSTLEIPCGDLGVFHFSHVVVPQNCRALHAGVDENTDYPIPRYDGGEGDAGSQIQPPTQLTTPLAGEMLAPTGPWIAVLDFDSEHGLGTQWLARTLAGGQTHAELLFLDDPGLAPLGDTITDLNVLATACRVAELVDVEQWPAPVTVNMSFGRSANAGDARSASDCARSRASCQVAQVLAHLRERGTRLVAAAGNHKQTRYPAVLREVIDTGMLALNPFFAADPVVAGAWESPVPVAAYFPGNALCLADGRPAAGGSSYSSALLAGWLAAAMNDGVDVDVNTGSPYEPRYDSAQSCYVLARGDQTLGACNHAAGTLFQGIEENGTGECWQGRGPNVVHSEPLDDPEGPLPITPFDQWVAGNGPLPESDPCVPCVGNLFGPVGEQDLYINMSQSGAIADGLLLDHMYLRVDQDFYPLPLASTQLAWIASAQVSELVVPDLGDTAAQAASSSLVFVLRTPAQGSCDAPPTPGCLWTSTPLFIAP